MTGSQASRVELLANLTGLTHDIFVGSVLNNVRRNSIASMVYKNARQDSEYRLEGQSMKFAVDLDFVTGGIATDGKLPDHVPMDAVQGSITPIRRYRRIALDLFTEQAASGPGSFEQRFGDRLFNLLWSSWGSMETRHAIGYASGLVCKVSSRSSSTQFVVKDGYGNTDTNPLSHLSKNAVIGWYDVSGSAVGGAGTITAINYSTKTITVSTAGTWEPGAALAADDLIYFATTPDSTASHFTLERNLAPNGLGQIVDPLASITTKFGIVEATYPRFKPMRQTSTTLGHMELTEHWLRLGSKRGFDVSPQTDVVVTFPSVTAQLARDLMAFQQQAYTGGTLKGGYSLAGGSGNSEDELPSAGLEIGGVPIYNDGMFYHNVLMTIPRDKLFRANLGGEADFYTGDGSQWARIADYDGQEAHVGEYMQSFSPDCGAFGALTGITTPDITDSDFTNIPDY